MIVLFQLKNGFSFTANIDKNTYLSKNFKLCELANNQGDPKKPQYIINADVDTHLSILQEFRLWYGKPMKVNSGYRQPLYNKKIGGVSDSLHKYGLACDFAAVLDEKQFMACAMKLDQLCKKRGIIGEMNRYSDYVHIGTHAEKNGYKEFQARDYTKPKGNKKYTLIKLL